MKDFLALAKMGHEANRQRGLKNAEQYRWIVAPLFNQGHSLRGIARTLDAYRLKTPEGGSKWTHCMVRRIVNRLGLKAAE